MAIKDYTAFVGDVAAAAGAGSAVWLDPSKVSYAVFSAAKAAAAAKGGSGLGFDLGGVGVRWGRSEGEGKVWESGGWSMLG